ncbi:hypothetical protein [Haloferula sp. BvORR071]|uniref:hypothetical protein n=1 Tax=Haloferula sp. BvORR071 TaxID=1396141 RepID=UPI002240F1BA|nr:hypothetical protein [Haloferula sp. BvORR071]
MKTKHSPSAVGGRGGHPSPIRDLSPKRDVLSHALLTAAIAVALSACSSSTGSRAPAGLAVLDATPDRGKRDRIKGIHVVSVNRIPVRKDEVVLRPGRNSVRIGYNWPQGGGQEVDLVFHARPDSSYVVQYEPTPAYANRLQEPNQWDEASLEMVSTAAGMGEGVVFLLPPAVALLGLGFTQRVGSEIAESRKPATYMDVMVVSKNNGEGIVRRVRAFPDGRVDSATWSAYAQMSFQSRLWR